MHEALLANSHVYDPTSGEWINQQFQRIAEMIHELSPDLALVWIPPAQRAETDIAPYAVMHTGRDGEPYIFMYVQEDELDERVIEKIIASSSDSLLERLHKMDIIQQKMRQDEQRERMEQNLDIAKSMWKSPKHTYKINGRTYHL